MTESTRSSRDLTGAMYFVVGRGTEGGVASYRLSVAGVSDSHWGDVSYVKQNSGYSIGTIQVDLGQRGTWPVGSIDGSGRKDAPSYVDAVITQSAAYAETHRLAFPENHAALRSDLLTHGNGKHDRPTLSFISNDTRTVVNEWASSVDGKKWIHANIDYPQVKNATEIATRMVDSAGERISEDHRLETVAILAKTANQFPSQLKRFQVALDQGGGYAEVLKTAEQIKENYDFYDGVKAADIARAYQSALNEYERGDALRRAEQKVADRNFDPSSQGADDDVREALHVIGGTSAVHSTHVSAVLRVGSHGAGVTALQSQLNELSTPSNDNLALQVDGHFGPATQAAIESFQRDHGMSVDGVAGPRTLDALANELASAREVSRMSLSDIRHPGVSLYTQALDGVRGIDEQRGRTTDQASCNLAGSLAVAACSERMHRIDHVVMSDDGARAYAVQGNINSPFKVHANVDVAQGVNTSLEQSGEAFVQATQQQAQQQPVQQQTQDTPGLQPSRHR
ncbi:peptidoglycan-binding domain-containing protein [Luteibacter sp. 22Crub2.1]|uniref:peptidoglycan-binding domain-containing protein n=1 Tax=Luteibacter sp. 22Crub2.1 TaxID=1283288 RepID=UPI0009A6021B|nr:peptidoglycan-binding domain-containing protein [Luteibacter sp. 22Crub2.1]SKB47626.1 Putative peptidoglycan-binding domain-containing protein [Luteibacter sp. 22Crub2.1]